MLRRESPGPANYMKNFEDLKNKAIEYLKKEK
jgi:hypothetical protein